MSKINTFKIKEIASYYNITPRTLRFYEEKNLISPTIDEKTKYRYYSKNEIERLERIVQLKAMGFSLENIKKCLIGTFSPLNEIQKCKAEILKQNFKLKELEFLSTKPNKYAVDTLQFPNRVTLSKTIIATSYGELIELFHDFISDIISQKIKLMPLKRYFIEHLEGKILDGQMKVKLHANVNIKENMPKDVELFKGASYIRTCHKGKWCDLHKANDFIELYAKKNNIKLKSKVLISYINGTFFTQDKNNLIQILRQINLP